MSEVLLSDPALVQGIYVSDWEAADSRSKFIKFTPDGRFFEGMIADGRFVWVRTGAFRLDNHVITVELQDGTIANYWASGAGSAYGLCYTVSGSKFYRRTGYSLETDVLPTDDAAVQSFVQSRSWAEKESADYSVYTFADENKGFEIHYVNGQPESAKWLQYYVENGKMILRVITEGKIGYSEKWFSALIGQDSLQFAEYAEDNPTVYAMDQTVIPDPALYTLPADKGVAGIYQAERTDGGWFCVSFDGEGHFRAGSDWGDGIQWDAQYDGVYTLDPETRELTAFPNERDPMYFSCSKYTTSYDGSAIKHVDEITLQHVYIFTNVEEANKEGLGDPSFRMYDRPPTVTDTREIYDTLIGKRWVDDEGRYSYVFEADNKGGKTYTYSSGTKETERFTYTVENGVIHTMGSASAGASAENREFILVEGRLQCLQSVSTFYTADRGAAPAIGAAATAAPVAAPVLQSGGAASVGLPGNASGGGASILRSIGLDGRMQVLITQTDATGWLITGDGYEYSPVNLLDGDETTSFQFSTAAHPLGKAYLYFAFSEPVSLDELWLKNGEWTSPDDYLLNSRVKTLTVDYLYQGSGKYTDKKTINLPNDAYPSNWMVLQLGRKKGVTGVRIRIDDSYPGTQYKDDVCISELMFVQMTK